MKPLIPPVKKMIDHIRITRLKLGLSQSQLAKLTGNEVSQSFITKLENRRIKPSYQKIHLLCKALDDYSKKIPVEMEPTAGEVCFKDVLYISSETAIKKTVILMRHHNYDQMPVKKDDKVVGSITLDEIHFALEERKGIYPNMPVSKIMGSPFPILNVDIKISSITRLFLDVPAVLVEEKGKIVGIITKIDLLI